MWHNTPGMLAFEKILMELAGVKMKIVLTDGSVLWSKHTMEDFVRELNLNPESKFFPIETRIINIANIAYVEETENANNE